MEEKLKTLFDSVKAEEALKNRTMEGISNKLYHKNKVRCSYSMPRLAVASLLCLLLIAGSLFYSSKTVAASTLRIAGEETVEMDVNFWDEIICVRNYDSTGTLVAEDKCVNKEKYQGVVEEYLCQYMEQFGETKPEISVSGLNQGHCRQMINQVEETYHRCRNHYGTGTNQGDGTNQGTGMNQGNGHGANHGQHHGHGGN